MMSHLHAGASDQEMIEWLRRTGAASGGPVGANLRVIADRMKLLVDRVQEFVMRDLEPGA